MQRIWRIRGFGGSDSALELSGFSICGGREAVVQFPDVFLQVKVTAEALAAGGAGERLLVVVRVHVEGEVVDLVKGLAADGALELLLAAVGQLVVLVVACGGGGWGVGGAQTQHTHTSVSWQQGTVARLGFIFPFFY